MVIVKYSFYSDTFYKEKQIKIKTMGKIEVIAGPMFSGKTTFWINRIKELKAEGKKVKVFKADRDNRYGNNDTVYTHNKLSLKAQKIKDVSEIGAEDINVIAIDEFHFFPSNFIEFCKKWKREGKHVLITGLDLDYLGNPKKFTDLKKSFEDLKSISDKIHFLKSKCAICGKEATMSERIVNSNEDSLVGGAESYRSVCKEHHPKWKKSK